MTRDGVSAKRGVTRDWFSSEPGLSRLQRELARLKTRAISRKWRSLFIALLITGAVIGLAIRKPHKFEAGVVVTITEGQLYDAATPSPKSQLRAYIKDVSFNKRHLFKLIEKYELYPSAYAIDPNLAVSTMWDDLTVEVYQNEFLESTSQENTRRSARVSIFYKAPTIQLATDVVTELRHLLVDFEVRKRRESVEASYHELSAAQDAAVKAAEKLAEQLLTRQDEWQTATTAKRAGMEIEIARLGRQLEEQYGRLDQLNVAVNALELRKSIEAENQGLLFQVVDEKRPDPHDPRPLQITILGVIVFVLVLPLAGIGVATFDSRVYDGGDVNRLGMQTIGHVPRFKGSRVGALSSRRRA